jgi:hypothetical protein
MKGSLIFQLRRFYSENIMLGIFMVEDDFWMRKFYSKNNFKLEYEFQITITPISAMINFISTGRKESLKKWIIRGITRCLIL